MALKRSEYIKALFTTAAFQKLEPLARLLLVYMVANADENGEIVGEVETLRMRAFPLDAIEVESVRGMIGHLKSAMHDKLDTPLVSPGSSQKAYSVMPRHSRAKVTYTESDMATAQWMAGIVESVKGARKVSNVKSWANVIRIMRETDKIDDATIRDVFSWANADEFWHKNVLCPETLRKQWNRLVTGMNKTKKPKRMLFQSQSEWRP